MNSSDWNDLLKRAADNYPLRTDSADWDAVARALDDEDPVAAGIPLIADRSSRNRKKYLLLLLLIPLAGIGYFHFANTSQKASAKNLNAIAQSDRAANNTTLRGASKTKQASAPDNKSPGFHTGPVPSSSINQSPATTTQPHLNGLQTNESDKAVKNNRHPITYQLEGHTLPSLSKRNNKDVTSGTSTTTGISETFGTTGTSSSRQGNEMASDNLANQSGISLYSEKENWQTALPGLWPFGQSDEQKRTGFIRRTAAKAAVANASASPIKMKPPASRYFYAGLLVAPDISTIKFQSVEGVGLTAGALIGYKFTRKLSVESGVYLDIKKYYSKGEYFDKKNVAWFNSVDLLAVSGSCSMLEVPLNVRYNFAKTKNNSWFATTGLSTYFVFNEDYNARFYANGYTGEKGYKTSTGSQNWFSILNFSAGYEHKIGKVGSLRVEPYLRIPMAGMGTGSLPILSSGLNIGIVRRIN